ncbi:MAG: choice-of-anchor B family protein [Saprospiraceae bacterium]|nr:choice-of-anchor B family protein [Saprospiraceae bacterium]
MAMTTTIRWSVALLLCNLLGVLQAQDFNITYRSRINYPGQTCANIGGWAGGGREYALVGASKGLGIVDVTDPDNPVKIVQVPGPDNFWREVKTYKHFAYVTTEGGQGLQIIDLSDLPSPTLDYHSYTGDGTIAGQLNTIHALHIDTTKGYAYLYGTNLFNGGAVVLDLNADPYHPTFVGKYDLFGYVHDGWVDNDTLYASHIYFGIFAIVDMTNKASPNLLGAQPTPNSFTHNTWLSQDRRHVFTTDEVSDSYLASFDVSDPEDIKLLDKIQANPGSNSIVHNTHVLENYAITSWYSDGVSIVDITRPNNLVQVGWYDNAPTLTGSGFIGCWGVYPYLPSGNLVATHIHGPSNSGGELWVLTPTYQRACYLEGEVTNALDGMPVSNALVEILGSAAKESTSLAGRYTLGQATPGSVQVRVSKLGFDPITVTAVLKEGEVTLLDFALNPAPTATISGNVLDAATGLAVPYAHVAAFNNQIEFETIADGNGQFALPGIFYGNYTVVAGAWGYNYATRNNQNLQADQTYSLELDRGYRDDFVFDYGWEVSGTSTEGIWEIGVPLGINVGIVLVPNSDWGSDIGHKCYITGNASTAVDEDDVESGTMNLISPPMDLTTYNDPKMRGVLFFTSFTQDQQSLDSIRVYVSNGIEEKLLLTYPGTLTNWRVINERLKPHISITDSMRVRIECFDDPAYLGFDTYEAAFDFFWIQEGNPVGTDEPLLEATLLVRPNPFRDQVLIEYNSPNGGEQLLNLYDLLGRLVESESLAGGEGAVVVGHGLQPGVYFARLEQNGQVSKSIRVVKVH